MTPDRVVTVRPRTVLMVIGIVLGAAAVLQVVIVAERVLIWTLVALFLAMALNPAVEWVQQHGVPGRGLATGVVYLAVITVLCAIGALIIPTLIAQVEDLIHAAPGYVRDLTAGRGPLGFLETRYHVVERVQDAVKGGGGSKSFAGGASAALNVTRSVVTFIVGVVTITFLTFFMLLEGKRWKDRVIGVLPEASQQRWEQIGHEIYRTVGGYVTGNIFISLIAGMVTTLLLLVLGVPYALALGLVVALLDLIPLAGATLAAIVVTLIGLTDSVTTGVILAVFFVIYQQLENHILQPVIYGRTVRLTPLTILIAILIGAEVAGVLGALAAIPVAGTVQILINDHLRQRRPATVDAALPAELDDTSGPPGSPAAAVTES